MAGRIVLDSPAEIVRVAALARPRQRVLVRVTPGVDAHTHHAVATGVEDQKFGFSLSSGAAADAVRRIVDQPELQLTGLHCHLGSQITQLDAFDVAARRLVALMAAVRAEHGLALPELNLGGGHGVPYVSGDQALDLGGFAERVRRVVRDACASLRLPVPRLTFEPGRAIVSRAMVTLYRVVTVKRAVGARTFVAVDGGMSDNPRPALYGSRYSAVAAGRPATPAQLVTVAGRHCEAGDVLARDVPLPCTHGQVTCSRFPAQGPTTIRWRRTTTSSGARLLSLSGTAPRACLSAARPRATCAGATLGCDRCGPGVCPAGRSCGRPGTRQGQGSCNQPGAAHRWPGTGTTVG